MKHYMCIRSLQIIQKQPKAEIRAVAVSTLQELGLEDFFGQWPFLGFAPNIYCILCLYIPRVCCLIKNYLNVEKLQILGDFF